MNINIDEKVIQELLEIEVRTIASKIIKRVIENYRFETEITEVVQDKMDDVIDTVIAEQDIEEVRAMVKAAMIKSIKGKLERAIKVHDGK